MFILEVKLHLVEFTRVIRRSLPQTECQVWEESDWESDKELLQ